MSEGDLGQGPRHGTQSIDRGLAVLRCFETDAELGVSELAARTGLNVATTHRIVQALRRRGLLEQDPLGERYHLGLTVAVLGQLALERLGFSFAVPELQRLAARTGESVSLGVRIGHEVLVLLQVASTQPLRFHQEPGSRNPLHVCAMGKALLAHEGTESLLGDRFERYTTNTLTTRDELEAEVARIREQGWALNDEERTPGVRAVGVPLVDRTGRAIAAVAIQGPTVRLNDDRVRELAVEVRATVRALSSGP
jgi:IclR family acetate operon transcriptional repressor